MIRTKRAYDPPDESDGARVLVDRLWPRGIAKEKLELHTWYREIAPSRELRNWFGHDPARWLEFKARYSSELRANEALLAPLLELVRKTDVTLIYGARDSLHNNAIVLAEYLKSRLRETDQ